MKTLRNGIGRLCRAGLCAAALLGTDAVWAGKNFYIYQMTEGETFELPLDSVTNSVYTLNGGIRAHVFAAAENCTVKVLPGANPGGEAVINASFLADHGPLTLDLSGLSAYSGVRLSGSIRSDGLTKDVVGELTGSVRVVGRGALAVGGGGDWKETDVSCPFLHTDISFADADAAGVTLTNDVAVMTWPASCPVTVAPATRLGLTGANPLGLADGATVAPADHDLYLLRKGSVPTNATVAVAAGRTLYFRPVLIQNYFEWAGSANNTTDVGVELRDATSRLALFNNSAGNNLRGAVTGTGALEMWGVGETIFLGDVDFQGPVDWHTGGSLVFTGSSAGDPSNPLTMHTSKSRLHFRPAGYNAAPTTAAVASFTGAHTNGCIHVYHNQTVTLGTAAGTFGLEGEGLSRVVIGELAANAVVSLTAGTHLEIGALGENVTIYLQPSGARREWFVTGPASGARVPLRVVPVAEGGTLDVGGSLDLGELAGFEAVNVAKDADVSLAVAPGTRLGGRGANVALTASRADTWKDKLILWVDAADTNGFEYVSDVWGEDLVPAPVTDGFRQLLGWRDVRPSQKTYQFRNNRFNSASSWIKANASAAGVCPCVIPNGIGTNAYVSMNGGSRHMRITKYNSFTRQILSPAYAVVVFGSQLGGGGALFATTNGALGRATAGSRPEHATNFAISTNDCPAYVDGVAARTATTAFNGDWQIIALDTAGQSVSGIGFPYDDNSYTPANRGYTQYAEILLFSEAPTDAERRNVEEYLAAKWNIALGGAPTTHRLVLSGSGELTLAQNTAVEGAFTGTVDLNGRRLTLSGGRLPPTEAEIPRANLLLWADPSLAGAVVPSPDAEKPLEVERLYTRDAAGLKTDEGAFALVPPVKPDGTYDRRPVVSAGARAAGSADVWIDFTDHYNDKRGNVFQFRTLPMEEVPSDIYAVGARDRITRTGFCVLDSSCGGGTPLADRAHADTAVKARASNTTTGWDAPIWAAGSSNYVLSAATYLDGVAVNGAERGFSGRPELLSFTFEKGVDLKAVGYYGNDAASHPNREILGEILLYGAALADDAREGVEAYLMKKWLGRLPAGFVDFRDMVVTGAGEVAAPSAAALPKFADAFTGTAAVEGPLSFAVGADGTVSGAVVAPGATFRAPSPCAVSVTVDAAAPVGVYTLVSCAAFAQETTFVPGTLTTGRGNATLRLRVAPGLLQLEAVPTGTMLILR